MGPPRIARSDTSREKEPAGFGTRLSRNRLALVPPPPQNQICCGPRPCGIRSHGESDLGQSDSQIPVTRDFESQLKNTLGVNLEPFLS